MPWIASRQRRACRPCAGVCVLLRLARHHHQQPHTPTPDGRERVATSRQAATLAQPPAARSGRASNTHAPRKFASQVPVKGMNSSGSTVSPSSSAITLAPALREMPSLLHSTPSCLWGGRGWGVQGGGGVTVWGAKCGWAGHGTAKVCSASSIHQPRTMSNSTAFTSAAPPAGATAVVALASPLLLAVAAPRRRCCARCGSGAAQRRGGCGTATGGRWSAVAAAGAPEIAELLRAVANISRPKQAPASDMLGCFGEAAQGEAGLLCRLRPLYCGPIATGRTADRSLCG